jgi:hypothetical protein
MIQVDNISFSFKRQINSYGGYDIRINDMDAIGFMPGEEDMIYLKLWGQISSIRYSKQGMDSIYLNSYYRFMITGVDEV